MNELEEFLRNAAKLRPAREQTPEEHETGETPTTASLALRSEQIDEAARSTGPHKGRLRWRPDPPTRPHKGRLRWRPDQSTTDKVTPSADEPSATYFSMQWLATPQGLGEALLAAEILRRPVERWERNW